MSRKALRPSRLFQNSGPTFFVDASVVSYSSKRQFVGGRFLLKFFEGLVFFPGGIFVLFFSNFGSE